MVKSNTSVYLIIEGESDTKVASLREGFAKLLSQVCSGRNPRIVMGEGKTQSIDMFLNTKQYTTPNSMLLVDLDGPAENKEKDIIENKLSAYSDRLYYMIQEMESWFLSQPEIINEYYQTNLASKFATKNINRISEPDKVIMNIASKANHKTRKTYHKVKDGAGLLLKLDARKLRKEFTDFDQLVTKINNA
jgi:hypothetical protein